jgi:hypothetical protein
VLPASHSNSGDQIDLLSQLYHVIILSFVFRMITSLLLMPRLKEIRRVKPVSVRRLIFRVVRFNPLSGLYFQVASSRRKHPSTPPAT